jgi:8-oxo-dGTP pyrophosphatase MutT (NUDIX family)
MTPEEKNTLIMNDFPTLWGKIYSRRDQKFNSSKKKYDTIVSGVTVYNTVPEQSSNATVESENAVKRSGSESVEDTIFITFKPKQRTKSVFTLYQLIENNTSNFIETSWGFPKGGREHNENNLDCAVREFCEETNYIKSDISLSRNRIYEEFEGTDKKLYKYIYYICEFISNYEPSISPMNYHQQYEIRDIKWMTLNTIKNNATTLALDNRKIRILENVERFIMNKESSSEDDEADEADEAANEDVEVHTEDESSTSTSSDSFILTDADNTTVVSDVIKPLFDFELPFKPTFQFSLREN